ncbi:MAG: AAC(3) family N-acetyltransferase [Magnetococcales bacterium]|nr:AAC(3) family N-acetyltransferase [Magnetococcales bacterium]
MAIPLPPWLKQQIKGRYKQWRLAYLRHRYAFGVEEFKAALVQLGLKEGDTVMVSSSMDCFATFTGRPSDIIEQMQLLLGPSGTMLMSTLPFVGSAIDWVNSDIMFDNRLTPSKMGLITELFRRYPGVVRSQHPTHAVAAKGARAEELCAGHHLTTTPCGEGSPYKKVIDVGGSSLLLGTGVETMIVYHAMEEILEPMMAISPFTSQSYTIESKTATGEIVQTNTRLFNPYLSKRRTVSKMIPHLKAKPGCWRQVNIGNMEMILLKTQDVLQVAQEMAKNGEFCYKE